MGALMWAGTFVLAIVAVMFPDDAVKGIASVAVVLLVTARVFEGCAYRPPEDHIGVIFRPADRRYRFIPRDTWTVVLPWIEEVRRPVYAGMTAVKTHHPAVPVRDGHPFEIAVDWAYRLDPRRVSDIFRKQFLDITGDGTWQAVISRRLNDLVSEVLIRHDRNDLLTDRGRMALKHELGERASVLVADFGFDLNPTRGVILQFVRPTARVWKAIEEHSASEHEGPAARKRVADLVDYLVARGISAADLWHLTSTVHATRKPAPPASVIPLADAGRTDGVLPISAPPPFGPTGDDHPDAPRPAA